MSLLQTKHLIHKYLYFLYSLMILINKNNNEIVIQKFVFISKITYNFISHHKLKNVSTYSMKFLTIPPYSPWINVREMMINIIKMSTNKTVKVSKSNL